MMRQFSKFDTEPIFFFRSGELEGDQFERQRQMVPAAEISPANLTAGETTQREQKKFRRINQDRKILRPPGFPCTPKESRRPTAGLFIDTFKFSPVHFVTHREVRQLKRLLVD
jgi:hypothetical protein